MEQTTKQTNKQQTFFPSSFSPLKSLTYNLNHNHVSFRYTQEERCQEGDKACCPCCSPTSGTDGERRIRALKDRKGSSLALSRSTFRSTTRLTDRTGSIHPSVPEESCRDWETRTGQGNRCLRFLPHQQGRGRPKRLPSLQRNQRLQKAKKPSAKKVKTQRRQQSRNARPQRRRPRNQLQKGRSKAKKGQNSQEEACSKKTSKEVNALPPVKGKRVFY